MKKTRISGPCERCGAARPLNAKRYCSPACRDLARTIPPIDRFWPKVNKDGPVHAGLGSPCWVWTGTTDAKGYGRFWIPGRTPAKVHRVAWEFANGPIPAGLAVCHRCDNASCCNPAHLFCGTLAENNRDMLDKDRARGPALLTAEAVRVIRAGYAAGTTQCALAQHWHVSQANIQAVVTRRTWKHVK